MRDGKTPHAGARRQVSQSLRRIVEHGASVHDRAFRAFPRRGIDGAFQPGRRRSVDRLEPHARPSRDEWRALEPIANTKRRRPRPASARRTPDPEGICHRDARGDEPSVIHRSRCLPAAARLRRGGASRTAALGRHPALAERTSSAEGTTLRRCFRSVKERRRATARVAMRGDPGTLDVVRSPSLRPTKRSGRRVAPLRAVSQERAGPSGVVPGHPPRSLTLDGSTAKSTACGSDFIASCKAFGGATSFLAARSSHPPALVTLAKSVPSGRRNSLRSR